MIEQGISDVRDWDRGVFHPLPPRLGGWWLIVDCRCQGIHVLVGSNKHRGPQRVRAWLPSLVHHCFLDDARTQRVLAEPNEKNLKMLQVSSLPSSVFLSLLRCL